MIAVARERHPDGIFTVQPCVPLPFENESMDVITVSCAFHHFEDPQAFARECMRVYSQKELKIMFELVGFTDVETYISSTILFFLARK